MCWFSPLTASKQIENAFTLPYIGVDIGALYVNLSVQAVFSLFAWRMTESAISATTLFGSFLKLVSLAAGEGQARIGLVAAGHSFIGLATVAMMSASMQRKRPTLYITAIPTGYLLSMLLTQIVFSREDCFFT